MKNLALSLITSWICCNAFGGALEDTAKYFSPMDISEAQRLGIPSFILVVKGGEIKEYQPGMKLHRMLTERGDAWATEGVTVLQ